MSNFQDIKRAAHHLGYKVVRNGRAYVLRKDGSTLYRAWNLRDIERTIATLTRRD